ncbi:hypothetical protein DAT1711_10320 [Enterococcus cecorum]
MSYIEQAFAYSINDVEINSFLLCVMLFCSFWSLGFMVGMGRVVSFCLSILLSALSYLYFTGCISVLLLFVLSCICFFGIVFIIAFFDTIKK